jgi:RNA polymerase sigma factor (sigma-70 family)
LNTVFTKNWRGIEKFSTLRPDSFFPPNLPPMPRLFGRLYDFFNLDPCRRYGTHELLFQGLLSRQDDAIQCLMLKSRRSVAFLVKKAGLDAYYTDDVLHEAVVIFLKKIETGAYKFEGHAPSTYLIEIARRVALNFSKKAGLRPLDELNDSMADLLDLDVERLQANREHIDQIERLLDGLNSSCKEIISLHYLQELSDDEVVKKTLVPISTIGSLKARRSQCMKRLRELVNGIKKNNLVF